MTISTVVLPVRYPHHPTRFSDRFKPLDLYAFCFGPFLTCADWANLSLVNNCRFTKADGAEKLKREMEARSSATLEEIREYEKLSGKPFDSKTITHFQWRIRFGVPGTGISNFAEFESVLSNLTALRSIDLGVENCPEGVRMGHIQIQDILLLIRQYSQLEKLSLSGWDFKYFNINEVLASCPRLHTLDISCIGSVQEVLPNLNPQMRELCIADSNITDDELRALVRQCPNLVSLNVSNCRNLTPEGLKVIAGLLHLHTLFASETSMNRAALDYIATFCPLQVLDISHCQNVFTELLDCIPRCIHLQSLNISSQGMVHPERLRAAIGPCLSLRTLILNECGFINLIIKAQNIFPRGLERLEIEDTECCLDWWEVLNGLPNLRLLKMKGLISDDMIQCALESCRELITLEIVDSWKNWCGDFNGDFLPHLVRCPRLENLIIKGVVFPENALLSMPECSRLQKFEIERCLDRETINEEVLRRFNTLPRTSAAELLHIANRCKFVSEIDVGEVGKGTKIADNVLASVFKNCPELKRIRFGEDGIISREQFFNPGLLTHRLRNLQTKLNVLKRFDVKCGIGALASCIAAHAYNTFGAIGLIGVCAAGFYFYRQLSKGLVHWTVKHQVAN